MSLRSRSHVKASMVLTRADHLFIHNYIRSLLRYIIVLTCILRVNLRVTKIKCAYKYIDKVMCYIGCPRYRNSTISGCDNTCIYAYIRAA